jgi:hypothetical protein
MIKGRYVVVSGKQKLAEFDAARPLPFVSEFDGDICGQKYAD